MSWQAYVDSNLLASGMVTAAGIYDLQGNPWAYSAGFAAQIAEVAAVSGHMHTGDPSGLAGTGVVVAGVKYMFVSGSEQEVYGKKGNDGVVFYMCNTCIIVGYHNDKIQAGSCSATVKELAETLKDALQKLREQPTGQVHAIDEGELYKEFEADLIDVDETERLRQEIAQVRWNCALRRT